ncbi:hypothetical protein M3Y94_00193500 [Aphelenchoides besseyi]|nr:hypothetical protein M3Y94_00193500 [Aphelenchoides besseyi]
MNLPFCRTSFQTFFVRFGIDRLFNAIWPPNHDNLGTIAQESACSSEESIEKPCRCCKMQCWYTIAKGATHELGHIPGEAGEQEALATLRLIRACMMEECGSVCITKNPFRKPMGLAALMEARKRLQS